MFAVISLFSDNLVSLENFKLTYILLVSVGGKKSAFRNCVANHIVTTKSKTKLKITFL
jgi:hypothetical protein